MNRAFLVGNLTKDPEFRKTENDVSVCTFTIACNRRPKPNGEREADFLNIVVWRGQADNCYRYLKKGRRVAVSGSIRTRSYDKNGERRYVTEIEADEVEFLSTKNEREDMTEVQTDDYPF
jgi:single-strand DNA-binding protein